MSPKIAINSISASKLKEEGEFSKYNIEVSLDELENKETEMMLKYRLVLNSIPTNYKISVEGIATLYGKPEETSAMLNPDKKNVPIVLNVIYQEVFPMFYVMSRSLKMPCPAFKLSEMSSGSGSVATIEDTETGSGDLDGLEADIFEKPDIKKTD